jgi:hypothetical protein
MTLEEALAEVDREVNRAFVHEEVERRLRFVTGWGPVLRPEVGKYLTDHPLVKEVSVDGPSIGVVLEDL